MSVLSTIKTSEAAPDASNKQHIRLTKQEENQEASNAIATT
jgi:hypothetical protein